MNVTPLLPDVAPSAPSPKHGDAEAFSQALSDVTASLERATSAEESFANGHGSLQSAVFERAQADVLLSVATAAAQRGAQALQSILNMQV